MEASLGASGQEGVRAGASRHRILELLRSASDGLGVQDLAGRTGLHGNTVRFHLDRLVADGLVQRHVEERGEPGRPRLSFTAAPRPDPARDSRNYQFLAEILASYVAGTAGEPATAAMEAGRTWGRYLTDRPAPYQRLSEEDAVGRLLTILDDIGFAPELARDDPRVIRLPHCPFREVAEAHREVVCAIHLGLMRGALAEMGAPVTAEHLFPFVEPSLCVAHLGPVRDVPMGSRPDA
ncbi:metalloregulator ArsR/SmtB family transcription factor [Blastococcus sp. TF02A-26]|uniref:helix-turn-helix transcriptional regulator n=1 Tax=Blastococcus sp. TF02A-26 TaxID=2250577 RepID=UPI000DE806CA|nr:helix-turn-helix domain-containing protein [Blastococcus sp. TF02A-26]RBY79661.1 ArsR family transcriptional regulator [Blastococcus sp. TF02A-26]